MRRILITILALLLLCSCSSVEDPLSTAVPGGAEVNAAEIPRRAPNTNNSTVGEFVLQDGALYYDGNEIKTTEKIRTGVNTLSVLNLCAFFFSQEGYGMWDLEAHTWKPLYYDVMYNAVTGVNNIYYIVKADYYRDIDRFENLNPKYTGFVMYTLSSYREATIFEAQVYPNYWEVVNNTLFYVTPTEIKKIDLNTDNVEVIREHEGSISLFEAREGRLIVIDGTQTFQYEAG